MQVKVALVRGAWIRHTALGAAVGLGITGAIGSLGSGDLPGNGNHWSIALVGVAYAWLGWIVTGRRPESAIGRLLLAGGVVEAAGFTGAWWATQSLFTDPGSLPGGAVAAWAKVWLQALAPLLVYATPLLLFPTGRFRSRRWRRFGLGVWGTVGTLIVAAAVLAVPAALGARPVELLDVPGVAHPGWAGVSIALASIARVLGFLVAVVGLTGVLWAQRTSVGPDRRAHTTVAIGAGLLVGAFAASLLMGPLTGHRYGAPELGFSLAALAIPGSIAVAIARFQTFEVRAVVSRSVLVAFLGSTLGLVYLGVLMTLSAVVDESTPLTVPSALAAGAVVLAGAPAAALGRRLTSRWFGRVAGTSAIAHRFSAQISTETGADEALQALADVLRSELRLGSVELLVDGLPAGVVGQPDGAATRLPMRYAGRVVGEVAVTARPGESLAGPDHRLLREATGYLAVACEAIRVSDDLRVAHHALQTAHTEERRRVRRDLHDGVAPTLASVRLKLSSLRRARHDDALDEVFDQVTDTIRDIRRIVDGLQPSVLEDLGLVPALQLLVADMRHAASIDLVLDAPPNLPELPADAANTAYRTVSEALANVVRHSRASTCRVHIEHRDGVLEVGVTDDGAGFEPARVGGSGLRSIATRASLAHGEASVRSAAGAGTTVTVRVPA